MDNKIIFVNHGNVLSDHYPKPAKALIPQWYKDSSSFVNGKKEVNKDGNTSHTIKKCMPVFDAITAGYIITTWVDIYVKRNENGEIELFSSSSQLKLDSHPIEQASLHPNASEYSFPKFISPWGIKTPKGYSCLFIPPMHHPNPYFSIFEGIVDTDEYTVPVNFPFALKNNNFEGLIPAGTPLAQVIPFKRDSWQMKLNNEVIPIEHNEVYKKLFSRFFDKYKNFFWQRKSFN